MDHTMDHDPKEEMETRPQEEMKTDRNEATDTTFNYNNYGSQILE